MRSLDWRFHLVVLLMAVAGILYAAPLPQHKPLLPLPQRMEEGIVQSEQRLERNIIYAEEDIKRLKKQGKDANRLPSPEHVRRAHLVEMIRLCRIKLDPVNGPKEIGGVPRNQQIEKALRQRLEMYQMRLHQGMLDGTVAKEDWVPPHQRGKREPEAPKP